MATLQPPPHTQVRSDRMWDTSRYRGADSLCYVIIPNAEVFTGVITNFSRSPRRRLQLEVGVAYNSDLDAVTEIIRQTISRIDGVIQDDPAPQIVFNTFGDSAINLTLYYWVNVATLGIFNAQDRVLKAVKLALEEAGIEIPYPTRAVVSTAAERAISAAMTMIARTGLTASS